MKKNDDFENTIQGVIYNVKNTTELEIMEQAIKDYIADKSDDKLEKYFFDNGKCKLDSKDYKTFKQKLKNDDKFKKQILNKIEDCNNCLKEFEYFYEEVCLHVWSDYRKCTEDYKKNALISNLQKLEDGILNAPKTETKQRSVLQVTTIIKEYLQSTYYPFLNENYKKTFDDIIIRLTDMCPKYYNRLNDLKQFYRKLYSIIQENCSKLPYLSKKYHEKYFKKACKCFIGAFIWFLITSLSMNIGHWSINIIEVFDINFEPILEVNDEWLKYIVWITIKTPSIILAWIGLSYLRAADRHDQDAKELSNLHQYKSMITDPVTQDALMVALAPNYFGTKRNRKSDNNFMEKLLLKMIPTLNINAGGGSNNGNNGGQNGGQNP